MNAPTIQTLHFTPITPQSRELYAPIAAAAASQSADHAFANLCIWNHVYHQEMAIIGERALVRFVAGTERRYLFPIGSGSFVPAIETLLASEPALVLTGLSEEEAAQLSHAFPDTFATFEERDIADYLYSAESLATLSGKKLHGKRNHINAFTAANAWSVRPLSAADAAVCFALEDAWLSEYEGDASYERRALETAFAAFDALDLHGALLYANGAPVAFTVGSMLTADTLCVHFEKALAAVQGAYPMINREFVRMMREKFPALAFVNREDDMGLENLRRAKLSYRPLTLIRKFTAKRV